MISCDLPDRKGRRVSEAEEKPCAFVASRLHRAEVVLAVPPAAAGLQRPHALLPVLEGVAEHDPVDFAERNLGSQFKFSESEPLEVWAHPPGCPHRAGLISLKKKKKNIL